MTRKIDPSLAQLDLPRVLRLVALETRTDAGRRSLLARRPASRLEEAELLQERLFQMQRFIAGDGLLPLSGIDDLDSILERSAIDLESGWMVVRTVRSFHAVREALTRTALEVPLLTETGRSIPQFDELLRVVGRFFTRDGKLREDATPELRRLRSQVHSRRNEAQTVLNDLMKRKAASVQEPIVTIRGDRYCIPVRSERRADVPGILHERSGSGASVFLEPMEVVEVNNEIADLLMRENEEIRRIIELIAEQILEHREEIAGAAAIIAELDATQAAAVIAARIEATRPALTRDRQLRIIDGRHPLLDERLASLRTAEFGEETAVRVVPVTVELEQGRRGLVISGPNAGGKTVALKTAGLLSAMAASGLPVPASEGTLIPIVDRIHLLIGDEQDVLGHLSTFSGYMTRLRSILDSTTEQSLVLLDEIGSGTDPEEGSAIATAVTRHLLEVGCLFIVTTHLTRLQTFAISEDRVVNASMEFEESSQEPTFRLIRGLPGRSRALEVARRVGLPASILSNAAKLVGESSAEINRLLSGLQSAIRENQARTEEIAEEQRELASIRNELERRLAEVREQKKKLGREWKTETDQIRREIRSRLREEVARLKQEANAAAPPRSVVRDVTSEILDEADKQLERHGIEEEAPESAGKLVPGATVKDTTFGFEGELRSIDGDQAEIIVRGKRMKVAAANLIVTSKPAATEPEPKRGRRPAAPQPQAEAIAADAELNLIGQRVEEALEQSDVFLDRAILDGKRAVRLIHGHGTGRLRDAIREYLRKHPAIESWRPGDEREGGDGATIAVLA
ncbi:MAG: Smr/MutS family protein [Acidobacteria bacterium]|nr:Smr/MutS family protein [Acidobacteriota bacterium]